MIIDFCSVVRKNLKYTLLPEPAWLAVKAFAKQDQKVYCNILVTQTFKQGLHFSNND